MIYGSACSCGAKPADGLAVIAIVLLAAYLLAGDFGPARIGLVSMPALRSLPRLLAASHCKR